MTSLLLNFSDDGKWRLDTSKSVSGLRAAAQASLVSVAAERGEYKAVPLFGTTMLQQGTAGLLSNLAAARHAANWAAAETLEMINSETPQAQWLQGFWLELDTYSPPFLGLRAIFQDATGTSQDFSFSL